MENQPNAQSVPIFGCNGKLKPSLLADEPREFPVAEPQYLSECSARDAVWDLHRSHADEIAAMYQRAEGSRWFTRLGERVAACAPCLGFAWAPDKREPGVLSLKIRQAFFCRVRHCPVCQWRRSLMWIARFLQTIPEVMAKHPNSRFIFLTLTVRNLPISELRQELCSMSKAWDRLRKRHEFAVITGWIRAVEVTRSANGEAHPHYHALLMVPGEYLRRRWRYVDQARWTALWKESARLDYNPIVHVKASRRKRGMGPEGGLIEAARETLKYSVKPQDLCADPDWLLELTRQLHKLRFIASGGALKDILREKDEDDEDLLLLREQQAETDDGPRLYFDWRRPVRRYKRRQGKIQ